ncbi:MAG: DNA-directed RNA polymerase subunit beta [Planctomycetota bacterium]|jgi:DNA-directed RNA polymerase subunit beta|nr:DNA-directed RNA polymerase subunit beta [Planctomycetota bacterium]
MNVRHYGKFRSPLAVPPLTDIQTKSYFDYLQSDVPFNRRADLGLEAILRETFPIFSYDKTVSLEYIGYELGRPRYTADECRILGVTYGMPFKILVRLEKPEPVEEWVYLGEIPIMVGGGEFIINGSERVIVSQLHRSPGVDFSVELHTNEKKLHSCWIIPQRGSWVELSVTKKDVLEIKIDQTSKFPATTFLRAMSEDYGTNEQIVPLFYKTKKISLKGSKDKDLLGRHVVADIVDTQTGEVMLKSGSAITAETLEMILASDLKSVDVILNGEDDPLLLQTLTEDDSRSHEEALLKIYTRLRPGNPPNIEKARTLFRERFQDPTRYRLGPVGRFRINRKFGRDASSDDMTLTVQDIIDPIRYIMGLRGNEGQLDDIDHLGNRRVRTIAELGGDEFRKGFLKLRRTASERMNNQETIQTATPRQLINSKTISSSIEYFFGRGELSQVVDQSNPLSQLTHERRLSALGPGGLNRKRAGFDVRDVHVSHYGRICPIETPEGSNIGLIASLSLYARLDEYGFLVTPYRKVVKGRVTDQVVNLRADEEYDAVLAPADTAIDEKGGLVGEKVLSRVGGEFSEVEVKDVKFVDISPVQLVGVSAALIPFLEHDDANRALMGSNMQRQAVPLIRTQVPCVATGMERDVAMNSGMIIRAKKDGTVKYVDGESIVVGDDTYELRKFVGLNEKTCLNQKPAVLPGQKVKVGDLLADGASTDQGELALGRNILVGFMIWDGYNFEDAIIVSEQLIREDVFTSIHIQHFDVEIRETKLGREEFTRDIPNVSESALGRLDETGVVMVGSKIKPGDILVGKVSPKSKSELTPEEKLLHAIFGRAGEDVKNDSLEVSPGVYGTVISTRRFTRNVDTSEEQSAKNLRLIRGAERQFRSFLYEQVEELLGEINKLLDSKVKDDQTGKVLKLDDEDADSQELRRVFELIRKRCMENYRRGTGEKVYLRFREFADQIEEQENEKNKVVNKLSRGDELPTGVLEKVKVFVATKRTLSVGDKMAGRHGNKGVISVILPEEDMPFLPDGESLQILLNPLGVPSRMNVGQILETHLGWAASKLGFQAVTPVFDGASEKQIFSALEEAGLPGDGRATLYDGRTGRAFDQKVTVGYLYMLKLHHLVADKVHARATGPYSLITQQPLGGKARFGGQRFGEMEVWALEAYGAASILQELLTVKSDDVEGRTRIYESMVKGTNVLDPGTPISFDVLTNEIRGLCLNMELHRGRQ